MSDDKKERLNKKLVEVIRDEKMSSAVRLKKLKYLVGLGADVNAIVDGKSVLVWAKKTGEADLIDFLEQKGAKEIRQATKKTGKVNVNLLDAASDGELQTVENLLKSGCDVDVKDSEGWTPLMLASKNGHEWVVEELLKSNPDLEARENKSGRTALMMASWMGHFGIVEMLVKKGADVNQQDNNKKNAVFYSILGGYPYVCDLLLDYNYDLEARDKSGRTALVYAAGNDEHENAGIVKMLLQRGADVEAKDDFGDTALINACMIGNFEMVEALLDKGADTKVKGYAGRNALSTARRYREKTIFGDNGKVVELLEKIRDEEIKTTVDNFVNKIFGGKGR